MFLLFIQVARVPRIIHFMFRKLIEKAYEKHPKGFWEASEGHISLRRHMRGIWEAYLIEEASGRHLRGISRWGDIWEASERLLRGFWEASERDLRGIWEASGRRKHLRGIWRHKLNLFSIYWSHSAAESKKGRLEQFLRGVFEGAIAYVRSLSTKAWNFVTRTDGLIASEINSFTNSYDNIYMYIFNGIALYRVF